MLRLIIFECSCGSKHSYNTDIETEIPAPICSKCETEMTKVVEPDANV
jgi:hypothetical protein